MNDKNITIELTPLMARVMQRMLVEEIEHQERWMFEEERDFGRTDTKTRENIIEECEKVRTQLEVKGFERYYKCN